ncbi:ATP-binding cassette domain-containing protein, partial [Staphylococcus aureus]|uniref:ATP-binding cassette domain-containing protein n=1 Tax=Staphylococcus aureus TaxID=1280 RepID=UPI0039BEB02A
INEFLHLEPEIISVSEDDFQLKGEIKFNHVSFVYPESGIRAIDDISFSVQPGQSLAILGHTGSGKSTIANLLERMYDVTAGEILLDGKPIQNLSLQSLRSQIGYVPQDVFLFSDTIGNNISFGLVGNMDEEKRKKLIR